MIFGTVTIGVKGFILNTSYFRGHGTYADGDKLIASVAGVVERVNKLICVRPFKTRYIYMYIYNDSYAFTNSCSLVDSTLCSVQSVLGLKPFN